MTDEIEIEDDDDLEEYEPRPAIVSDGDVLLADPIELFELTDTIAAQFKDGGLYLLKRDGRWINVEDALKPARTTVVAAVRTKQ